MGEQRGEILRQLVRWLAPAACCLLSSMQTFGQGAYYAPPPQQQLFLPAAPAPNWNAPPPGVLPYGPLPQHRPEAFAPVFAEAPLGLSTLATPQRPGDLLLPNMIGDALGRFGTIDFTATDTLLDESTNGSFDIPISGRLPKVAENNSPVPRDRVYFAYNYFNGAYGFRQTITPSDIPIDPDPDDPDGEPTVLEPRTRSKMAGQNRFTLGIEKAFFFDDMSLELRVPLVTQTSFSTQSVTDPTLTSAGIATNDPTGNVALNFKQVLLDWYGEKSGGLLTWGLGLTFPTAEGATAEISGTRVQIDDSALHFSPFLALAHVSESGLFCQAFFQFDFTNDSVEVRDSVAGKVGDYRPASQAYIDLGIGYWLFHNPQRRFLQGLAPIFEFHYSGQLRDVNQLTIDTDDGQLARTILFNASGHRRNVYNLTGGLHAALTDWMNVRAAGVFPYKSAPDREFDAEFVFQLDILR